MNSGRFSCHRYAAPAQRAQFLLADAGALSIDCLGKTARGQTLSVTAEFYLHAATVDDLEKCYFIGPFGQRVSFASQQMRSYLTVWALETVDGQKRLAPSSRVAVVGAGVAGLTVTAALLARKHAVTLFELGKSPLRHQEYTSHRYLHPTINFWPEHPFKPTTNFPFFDWHEALTSEVAKQFKDDWDRGPKLYVNGDHFNDRVKSIERRADGVFLISEKHPGGSGPFDAVIFTTGFGQEAKVSGTDSKRYWEVDSLATLPSNPNGVRIAGTGDGGLVDALRAVHQDFHNGALCVDFVRAASATATMGLVKKIEDQAVSTARTPDELSLYFATAYAELVSETPKALLGPLDKSILRDIRVELVGRGPSPFNRAVAPVHKFLIAHAIKQGALTFVRGKIDDQGKLLRNGSSVPEELPDNWIQIARLGSTPDLNGILSDAQIDELKKRQGEIGDKILKSLNPPYADDFWCAGDNGLAKPHRASYSFVRDRLPKASHLMGQKFQHAVSCRQDKERWIFVATPFNATAPDIEPISVSDLFGIPLSISNSTFEAHDYSDRK